MSEEITTEFNDVQMRIIKSLMPFYGSTKAEVIKYITINWIAQNIINAEKIQSIFGK